MAIPIPVILTAISIMSEVAQARSRDQANALAAQYHAGVLHDLIDAAIHKKYDVVRSGFESILAEYSAQARHFMAQQARYADEEFACTDPIRRIELQSRMRAVDKELQCIRIDADLLYARMTEAIVQLGGSAQGFAENALLQLTSKPQMIS